MKIKKLCLSAFFMTIGIVLPMLFGQIPQIGSMLLPMHIPVYLCAYICGWQYGAPMAIILPLIRSILFGRPNLYPEAISVAAEMAVYALISGKLYSLSKIKSVKTIYLSLLSAMIIGRIFRSIVQLILLGAIGKNITFIFCVSELVIHGLPGIIIQLMVIPPLVLMLRKIVLINKL